MTKSTGVLKAQREKAKKAFILRVNGNLWTTIAADLGYFSPHTASTAVDKFVRQYGLPLARPKILRVHKELAKSLSYPEIQNGHEKTEKIIGRLDGFQQLP